MKADLSLLAGPTGVGALVLLGLFLIVDGRSPQFFPTFESYASSTTFGIVAALPVLSISYVLGIWAMSAGQLLGDAVFRNTPFAFASDLATLAGLSFDGTVESYLVLAQERRVLGGSAVAFLFLAAGALSEVANLRQIASAVRVLAVLALVGSVSLLKIAETRGAMAHDLVVAVQATSDVDQGGPPPP